MNLNASEASLLVHRLQENIKIHQDIEVVLAPSTLTLQPLSMQIDRRKFRLAAQDAYFKDEGAFTGAVSFNMLRGIVHYCLIGHSERRLLFGEDLKSITAKMKASVRNGITPILCVGETAAEKEASETRQVIHDQLVSALRDLTANEVSDIVIAYEPVWAIGSGQLATPSKTNETVNYIRDVLSAVFNESVSKSVRILYGGSVVSDAISSFLEEAEVDGFLVGGASLNWHEFADIVDNAYTWQRNKQE